MNSIRQLEFDKIIDLLKQDCHSKLGEKQAEKIAPLIQKKEIEYRLELTSEMQELLMNNVSYNFEKISQIEQLLLNFKHHTYNFDEFQKIHFNISTANSIEKEFDEQDDFPNYLTLIEELQELADLENRFNEIFTPEGEINDNASSELATIRRRKRQLKKNIIDDLNQHLKNLKRKNFLQDDIITQRDGRYVLPVKEGSASFVKGIVHGRSASKASVFVEPEQIVAVNNELDLTLGKEKQEIFQIKKEFTAQILASKKAILKNTKILEKLDVFFALARFANRLQCHKPKIISKPQLKLISARHPLLIKNYKSIKKVIPFNLELGKDFRLLLISGPNTGGKTVTLKTVGILTLMALSGIPIPAEEDSEIGIFTSFFADIGDYQSLENSLSTFSSHINNIDHMLKKGDRNSLVLIDEIGAATDPEQGSALAQAILENITERKCVGVITTHYTALKVFAEKNENCQNAAMQFDPKKHIPTYHFKLGLPGNSFAIEVASKLGMDQIIITRAKHLAGDQNIELTELLKNISSEKKELARQNYEYKLKTALLKQKIDEYEKKIIVQEKTAKEIKKKTIREARSFLTTMQKELTKEIDDLQKENRKSKKEKLKQTFQKISAENKELKHQEDDLTGIQHKKLEKIRIGQKVLIKDMDVEGEIIEIAHDQIKVDLNGIVLTTKQNNLLQVNNSKEDIRRKKVRIPPKHVAMELKLLGYRFEEAIPEIDRFLDNAIFNGLNKVRIVHGKGTGALRQKIREYLRKHRNAKDFYSPEPAAGGNGVTIVKLKS